MPDLYDVVETGPTFRPLQFGLLAAAEPIVEGARFRMGVQRRSLVPCGPAQSLGSDPCTIGPVTGAPSHEGVQSYAGTPFWVYGTAACSPVGWGNDLAELRARANRSLTDGEGRAVERVFWTGRTSQTPAQVVYPHLAAAADEFADPQGAQDIQLQAEADVIAGLLDPVEALGLLEVQLAHNYGGEGVIHVPRDSLAHLSANYLIRQVGQQLRTTSGNVVAAYGPLQAGIGPDQTPLSDREALWWYATPPVSIYRGEIQDYGVSPSDVMDLSQNTAEYRVGRAYLLLYEPCPLVAVQVSHGGVITGQGGDEA